MGNRLRLMRVADVEQEYGISRSTLNTWRSKGLFPEPIQIGPNTIAWKVEEVEAWLKSKGDRK